MLSPDQVTAVIVTRGDVDLAPVLDSLIFDDVVVWDNSRIDLTQRYPPRGGHPQARVTDDETNGASPRLHQHKADLVRAVPHNAPAPAHRQGIRRRCPASGRLVVVAERQFELWGNEEAGLGSGTCNHPGRRGRASARVTFLR